MDPEELDRLLTRLVVAVEALAEAAKFQTTCLEKMANPLVVAPPAPRHVAVAPHKTRQ